MDGSPLGPARDDPREPLGDGSLTDDAEAELSRR